jgi:hypothetical protein
MMSTFDMDAPVSTVLRTELYFGLRFTLRSSGDMPLILFER